MTISIALSHYESICFALKELNFRCNGAINEDGVGFNKSDSHTGKSFVAFIERGGQLTESEQLSALTMLQKYRKQLLNYGVDLPTVDQYQPRPLPSVGPTPVKQVAVPNAAPVNPQLILIDYNGFMLVVTFKYNEAVKNLISSLPKDQRRFEKFPEPCWNVNPALLNELINRLPTATLTPKVQALLQSGTIKQSTPVVTPVTTPVVTPFTITLENGMMILTFEYDAGLVAQVKELPDRKWDKDRKLWLVPVRHAETVCKKFPQAQIDPAISGMIEGMIKLIEKANAEDSAFDVPLLTGSLMPFQRAGVEYLEMVQGKGIIGDDMGLGKTIQAIA